MRADDYKTQLTLFIHDQSQLSSLNKWVSEHVDGVWLQTLDSSLPLNEQIADLRKRIGTSTDDEVDIAVQNYRDALRTSKQDPELWYNQWEVARIEGARLKIRDLEGRQAYDDFFNSTAKMAANWTESQRTLYHNARQDSKETKTLKQLGELFVSEVRRLKREGNLRSRYGTNVFSIQETGADKGNVHGKDCPCGLAKKLHKWPPTKCDAVHVAVLGYSPYGRKPVEKRVDAVKGLLSSPHWQSLFEKIRRGHGEDSSGIKKSKESQKWPAPMNVVLDSTNDPAVIFSTPGVSNHPLSRSTVYDNCGGTHLVNNRSLLEPGTILEAKCT